jgi:tetratricopeptide (TPR) repeat protein
MRLLDEAIALDPKSGEAYVERGYLKAYFDIAAADADLRRGIELSPNYARGHEGLAAVLFQSVARRREALEMLEKARRLDPLDPRLDVIKAAYLHYGPGDTQQAVAILRAVLERDPLYVPALVRLGNLRWNIGGAHAESILLVEQAVALDAGNETAWRQLGASYLEVDDAAAAEESFDRIGYRPPQGWLSMHLYRKDWRKAGEAAYAMIAAGSTNPPDERRLSLAIRMHARATGDFARAIRTLEQWALVEWEGDTPLLGGQLDEGISVAGLADLLAATGEHERARALADELLADTDVQMVRYGRGAIWLSDGRAMALTLLGRPEDAMLALQRQAKSGSILHEWRFMLVDEPVFDALRQRADFRALLADARANAAREREQLERMRADGLVPKRGAAD